MFVLQLEVCNGLPFKFNGRFGREKARYSRMCGPWSVEYDGFYRKQVEEDGVVPGGLSLVASDSEVEMEMDQGEGGEGGGMGVVGEEWKSDEEDFWRTTRRRS